MAVHSALLIFLTFGLSNFFVGTALESYFCENVKCSNLGNRICTNYLLWTVTETRKSQCFLKCLDENEGCQAVFYNDMTRKCQGHSSALTNQDNCHEEEGTKYYHKCTGRGPGNCQEILCSGQNTSGIYTIYPNHDVSNGVSVRCDMDTDGGGWTVFQRRVDGSVNFYRKWADYKSGFGNADTEYWLGLDNIHKLTSRENVKLRVDLITPGPPKRSAYAVYSTFTVGDETNNYILNVIGYSGDAGDSMSYHAGMQFTTQDKDNDIESYNCAAKYFGGWWYKNCHGANLNGVYGSEIYGEGINWKTLSDFNVSMMFTEMKLR